MNLLVAAVAWTSMNHVLPAAAADTKAHVVYSFCSQQNCADGKTPYAPLVNVNGILYGTTHDGGTGNGGTVFRVDLATGTETTLYSFCSQRNCADGQYPYAGLTDVNGILYGTTRNGGPRSGGLVFSFDPNSGTESTVYSFCTKRACSSVGVPTTGLTEVKGKLYGTAAGGAQGDGAVFVLNLATGKAKVLYSFCSQPNCSDGEDPGSSLIDVKGKLYGTTTDGGGSLGSCQYGCGVVFSVDEKTGAETVLYTFCSRQDCADGRNPEFGSLLAVSGSLYGTTQYGGANDGGVVFALDPSTGGESVLYSFCSQQNCTDGLSPLAGVIAVKGTLYGTTSGGGTGKFGAGGTVFSLDPTTGSETVILSLCGKTSCPYGEDPTAGLIDVSGMLYGTAALGGAYFGGTVFSLKR